MRKRRILLVILVVIIILVAGLAAYVTMPSWYPRSTILVISPATSTVQTGSMMAFTATVKYGSMDVAGGTITWTVTAGSLDRTTGPTVVFIAPAVTSDMPVTITASFSGKGVYQQSSASVKTMVYPISGTVTTTTTSTSTSSTTSTSSSQTSSTTSTSSSQTSSTTSTSSSPASILPYLYTMTFQSAQMTNVKFTGPITMNGTSVTLISADIANITGFYLNRINLNASTINLSTVEWFVTYADFNSVTSSNAIQVQGGQTVNIGPIQSASYTTGNMSVVQWNGASAYLAGMVTIGQPSSGSEPYIPNILMASEADLLNDYYIQGPVTELNENVSSIITGKVTISQFSFIHPGTYSLDRQSRTVSFTNEWLMEATSVTGINVTAYSIYFDVSGFNGLETVIASGNDNMHNEIPHGYTSGNNFPVTSITVDTVYFSVQQLSLSSFVLSIE